MEVLPIFLNIILLLGFAVSIFGIFVIIVPLLESFSKKNQGTKQQQHAKIKEHAKYGVGFILFGLLWVMFFSSIPALFNITFSIT